MSCYRNGPRTWKALPVSLKDSIWKSTWVMERKIRTSQLLGLSEMTPSRLLAVMTANRVVAPSTLAHSPAVAALFRAATREVCQGLKSKFWLLPITKKPAVRPQKFKRSNCVSSIRCVGVRATYGAFEDDNGRCSHLDGANALLKGDRQTKRVRVDLLTSCAKALRSIGGYLPDFVVGLGQGGIIAGMLRFPLVVEVTLQAQGILGHQPADVEDFPGGGSAPSFLS